MDDYSTQSLGESKNEYVARLINILTPLIRDGFHSIFNEAIKLCNENNENDKYLMTFQNFLSRITKWNTTIIEEERKRIIHKSGCTYLEDLITCVHIIQLKALSCIRVSSKQKKVDIDVPSLDDFIHKVYITTARKLYTNVFLFEKNISPLETQKNNRELELIIRECILNTVRDNVPVEKILRTYMDETDEVDVQTEEFIVEPTEEEKPEENMTQEDDSLADKNSKDKSDKKESKENLQVTKINKVETPVNPIIADAVAAAKEENPDTEKVLNTALVVPDKETTLASPITPKEQKGNISFETVDKAINVAGVVENIEAPKTVERLEEISTINNEKRKVEEAAEDAAEAAEGTEEPNEKISIGSDINLNTLDVHNMDKPIKTEPDPLLTDVEVLA